MGTKKLKILIADDHALIREGLKQILEEQPDFHIIESSRGDEALMQIIKQEPEIAVLDIEMPGLNGFELARKIHNQGLSIDVIFLTMFKDETIFNKAMDIGVKGYVLKENTVSEILNCIELVARGKHYISPEISDFLIRRNSKLMAPASDKNGLDQLTDAEKNIIRYIAEMKTNPEIAEILNISIKTVYNHRNNICKKLELSGTQALLKFAVEHIEKT